MKGCEWKQEPGISKSLPTFPTKVTPSGPEQMPSSCIAKVYCWLNSFSLAKKTWNDPTKNMPNQRQIWWVKMTIDHTTSEILKLCIFRCQVCQQKRTWRTWLKDPYVIHHVPKGKNADIIWDQQWIHSERRFDYNTQKVRIVIPSGK